MVVPLADSTAAGAYCSARAESRSRRQSPSLINFDYCRLKVNNRAAQGRRHSRWSPYLGLIRRDAAYPRLARLTLGYIPPGLKTAHERQALER